MLTVCCLLSVEVQLTDFLCCCQNTSRAKAPSATGYELQMEKAAKPGSGWADAALAGLPPEDEAVQMAELAATAGRSLEVTPVSIPAQSAELL